MLNDGADAVAIGVPVRNEVDHLPFLLRALTDQVDVPPFTLCLFFDSCEDGSEALAETLRPSLPFDIATDCSEQRGPANAGLARSNAMRLAARVAPNGILLTTDADGEPASGWIAANLAALSHADVVAGRIERNLGRRSTRQDEIEGYYHRMHLLRRSIDPVSWEAAATHHWCSGASLAMRAWTYRELGGFPHVANGEDAALCDAAARRGLHMRRDADVFVRTSARRSGRASGGFAAALALLDGEATSPLTCHPEDEAWRFHMQAAARRCHGTHEYHDLSRRLGLPLAEVEQVALECCNGEAFAARIVGTPPTGLRAVTVSQADELLSMLEQRLLESAA